MMQYTLPEIIDPPMVDKSTPWIIGDQGHGQLQMNLRSEFQSLGQRTCSPNNCSGGNRALPECTKWMAPVGPCRWVRCDAHRPSEWVTVTNCKVGGLDLAALLNFSRRSLGLTGSSPNPGGGSMYGASTQRGRRIARGTGNLNQRARVAAAMSASSKPKGVTKTNLKRYS